MTELLETLIKSKGIGTEFVDAWGNPTEIAEENQQTILKAMGYIIDDAKRLSSQLQDESAQQWLSPLNPVSVFRQSNPVNIVVRVASSSISKKHTLRIETESGQTHKLPFIPSDLASVANDTVSDIEYHQFLLPVSVELECGYHTISLLEGRKQKAKSQLIIAPQRCYIPDNLAQGKKVWGLSVQLYCLKSERNWGVGDFTDLSYLIQQSAKLGADFIGLNPIHALYPAMPESCSPYAPSSRRWLNPIYIDVESVSGFDSPVISQLVQDIQLNSQLAALRATDYVDYPAITALKMSVLRRLYDEFCNNDNAVADDAKERFALFKAAGGKSLEVLATFEALQTHLKNEGKDHWGWPAFPPEYQDPMGKAVKVFVKENQELVGFHMYLQWIAAEQLKMASDAAKDSGMLIGLYRDLAVGVSEGSAEIWGNQDLYSIDVSVGAPPDVLGPLGQKWGLPPMDPDALYRQAYQPIIDLFSSNMQDSGALRIDHAMALLRLWWVHKNDTADKGVYVNYPVEDLLAILALESQRNKSLVIGEDLGTVPDEIRELLQANGIFSYRVFFFEQAEDGGFYSPSHYPEQSMATLTTHDMPTLIGFWHCHDFELGKDVGVYPDEDVLHTLYQDRHDMKQQILDSLHGHQSIPEAVSRDVNYVGMSQELNFGMQLHMAKGSSALLSLQLEDWLQMDKPVNIPGTYNEYPNWRRKLSANLSEIFNDPDITSLAFSLSDKRNSVSKT